MEGRKNFAGKIYHNNNKQCFYITISLYYEYTHCCNVLSLFLIKAIIWKRDEMLDIFTARAHIRQIFFKRVIYVTWYICHLDAVWMSFQPHSFITHNDFQLVCNIFNEHKSPNNDFYTGKLRVSSRRENRSRKLFMSVARAQTFEILEKR